MPTDRKCEMSEMVVWVSEMQDNEQALKSESVILVCTTDNFPNKNVAGG